MVRIVIVMMDCDGGSGDGGGSDGSLVAAVTVRQ